MSDEPGLFHALSDTISRATDLVQLEVRVFKAELDEKLSQVKAGVSLILSGAIFIAAALFLLLQAAVLVLVEAGLSPALATLLVAGASIVIGIAFMLTGRRQVDGDALTPDRTIRDLQRDTRLVKEKLS
ncbi:MAG TPA: phage holin family protein [Reyranella sp.]|nr:phage holin family protein [Reyranella sp.]